MAVFKINKTSNYTVMSNRHFKEKEMTLKAKGLLSLMLSLPANWDYSIAGLVAICKENESAINSTLKELKDFGYLKVDKLMPNKTKSGRIEYIYNIYEAPTEKQDLEKQDLENQPLEIQALENQTQLNNNLKNKKEKENNINETLDSVESQRLKEVLNEFIKMRKTIKKPLTAYGLELILKNLNKLSTDIEEQIRIVEQSIEHCWQGVFALKDKPATESIAERLQRLGGAE